MNKFILFMLFLIIIKDSYAFTGESASYRVSHSNINTLSVYDESDNYTMDASLVSQPVGVNTESDYVLTKGFYHPEFYSTLLSRFMKAEHGVYPVLLLVMMLYIAIRENGKKKKIQEANMAQ